MWYWTEKPEHLLYIFFLPLQWFRRQISKPQCTGADILERALKLEVESCQDVTNEKKWQVHYLIGCSSTWGRVALYFLEPRYLLFKLASHFSTWLVICPEPSCSMGGCWAETAWIILCCPCLPCPRLLWAVWMHAGPSSFGNLFACPLSTGTAQNTVWTVETQLQSHSPQVQKQFRRVLRWESQSLHFDSHSVFEG